MGACRGEGWIRRNVEKTESKERQKKKRKKEKKTSRGGGFASPSRIDWLSVESLARQILVCVLFRRGVHPSISQRSGRWMDFRVMALRTRTRAVAGCLGRVRPCDRPIEPILGHCRGNHIHQMGSIRSLTTVTGPKNRTQTTRQAISPRCPLLCRKHTSQNWRHGRLHRGDLSTYSSMGGERSHPPGVQMVMSEYSPSLTTG